MTDASDTAHQVPGRSIPVSAASQTEEFFAASWSQYEGVDAIDKQIAVLTLMA